MTPKIKYPVGIQTFSEIRNNGYLYIDKTDLIYQLVKTGKYFFLSRPRRFGKSLLLSTIEAYFQGRKELFEGLAISEHEKEWIKYPVFHFDMNLGQYDEPTGVYDRIDAQLSYYESIYGRIPNSKTLGNRFEWVLRESFNRSGLGAVILIDEYEKSILEAIDNPTLQDHFRAQLKPFYGVLKTCDKYIKFAFLTGVTRIGKLSIFSDLNNLNDISMVDAYSQICGITRSEIETQLIESVNCLARKYKLPAEKMYLRLKHQYDGYRFSYVDKKVYNPYSLFSCFTNEKISDYWFESGTPSSLIRSLRNHNFNLWDMDGIERAANKINSINSFDSDPIPLIYQSGYLTIKEVIEPFDDLRLGFPNREVRQAFINSLLPIYVGSKGEDSFHVRLLIGALNDGNVDGFLHQIQAIFADIPYVEAKDFQYEGEFRNVLYIIFSILGFYTQVEKHIGKGRVDLVVKTVTTVYVMEFKLNGTAEEALTQINSKDYCLPYQIYNKKILKVGVAFSSDERNIINWEIE